MMTGKQKLYFLIDAIEDARAITPSGEPIYIHPMGELLRTSMRKNEKSIGPSKRKLTAKLPSCILLMKNTI